MICEAFGCPPDIAARQDWPTVRAILEYREAQQAIALINRGTDGVEALQREPQLLQLMLEIHRAQFGGPAPETADMVDSVRERGAPVQAGA